MDITRTVETAAPLGASFAFLSDFLSTNEWDPGTVETTLKSGDGGVGSVYRNVSSVAGNKTELEYTITEITPQRRFVARGVNKTVVATDTMTFEATPAGGTKVTYHVHFDFQGLFGKVAPVLYPVLRLAFKKLGDDGQRGMQDALDKLPRTA